MTLEDPLTSERSAIERAQAEPAHFALLYEQNVNSVFAHVLRRCGSRSAAEDITSEVFLRALRGLPRFEWRGVPYLGYLRRIADNLLTDFFRSSSRELRLDAEPDEAPIPSVDSDDRLLRLASNLPPDQRRVLGLRFGEDKSIAEVAAILGRSEGAVKQLQHRAISTLRAWLAAVDSERKSE